MSGPVSSCLPHEPRGIVFSAGHLGSSAKLQNDEWLVSAKMLARRWLDDLHEWSGRVRRVVSCVEFHAVGHSVGVARGTGRFLLCMLDMICTTLDARLGEAAR